MLVILYLHSRKASHTHSSGTAFALSKATVRRSFDVKHVRQDLWNLAELRCIITAFEIIRKPRESRWGASLRSGQECNIRHVFLYGKAEVHWWCVWWFCSGCKFPRVICSAKFQRVLPDYNTTDQKIERLRASIHKRPLRFSTARKVTKGSDCLKFE